MHECLGRTQPSCSSSTQSDVHVTKQGIQTVQHQEISLKMQLEIEIMNEENQSRALSPRPFVGEHSVK